MITLIFPGYSLKNKVWAQSTADSLKLEGQIRPVFWDHWEDETQKFIASEKALLASRHSKGDTINIVAKSIGTLVTAYSILDVPSQINKVILNGIPMTSLSEEDKKIMTQAFKDFPSENIVCFQNSSDPLGSFNEVKEFLGSINPSIKVIEKEASDHDYPYYEDFQKFLEI